MSLHGPGQTRRRFFAGSMVIVLATAALGLASSNRAGAQIIDPRSLLEAVKKKGTEDPKKKLPGVLSGKKDATRAVVTPKNLPKNLPNLGKGLPTNLGNNQPSKNLIGRTPDAKSTVLSKGVDPKNAIGKAGDLKNAKSTIGNLGKGTDAKTALSKSTDLPKG